MKIYIYYTYKIIGYKMTKWLEALKANDYLTIKQLIKQNEDINTEIQTGENVLITSLRYRCDYDLVMLLIENGADMYDFDDEGVSVFEFAITYDYVDLVKLFIEKGLDINTTKRRSGFTPLMCTTCYSRVEIIKLLLENSADKTLVDYKGLDAYGFAKKMHKKSIMQLLEG